MTVLSSPWQKTLAWSHASDGTPYVVLEWPRCPERIGAIRCIFAEGHIGTHLTPFYEGEAALWETHIDGSTDLMQPDPKFGKPAHIDGADDAR